MLEKKSLIIFALFMLFSSFLNNKIAAQTTVSNIPEGDWAFSIHTYQGNDFLDIPVVIYQVSSKRAGVERFYIYNISRKSVKAIKVRWMLYENEDRTKSLQQGRTGLLNFSKELSFDNSAYIRYPVIALTDFSGNYLVNNKLNKNFDVDLVVDEVLFADNSVWKIEDGRYSEINQKLVSAMRSPADCPMQKCISRPSKAVRGGITYSCGASEANESCVNSVSGEDCTNSACVRAGGPGGGGSPFEIILD